MRKLEELLNLPENRDLVEDIIEAPQAPYIPPGRNQSIDPSVTFDKIEMALPIVTGLGDQADYELDDLAEKATKAYEDMMDLAMNVEPRFSARIMEVASIMLKNAIDAKTKKIDSKLKIVDLQLKKQKVDYDTKSVNETEIKGEGYVVTDRNSLLEKMRKLKNPEQ